MAVKYRFEFTSRQFATPYRLDISVPGYEGAIIEVNGAGTPVVLRKDADACIRGTSLEIALETDQLWGMEDLYSQAYFTNLVQLYRSNVLIWQGYTVPDEYSDTLIAPPFDVNIKAVDGIGLLKEIPFELQHQDGYGDSPWRILNYCLQRIGNSLPVVFAIDVYEEANLVNGWPTCDPWVLYSMASLESFYGMNCYDVLSLLLRSFGKCTMTLTDGAWHIIRDVDAIDTPRYGWVVGGNQQYNLPAPTLFDLNKVGAGDIYPIDRMSRAMLPSMKEVTIKQDYGLKRNFFRYGENRFEDFDLMTFPDDSSILNNNWKVSKFSKYWEPESGVPLLNPELTELPTRFRMNKPRTRASYVDSTNIKEVVKSDYQLYIGPTLPYYTNKNWAFVSPDNIIVNSGTTPHIIKFNYYNWHFTANGIDVVSTNTASNEYPEIGYGKLKIKCGTKWLGASGWQSDPYWFQLPIHMFSWDSEVGVILNPNEQKNELNIIVNGFPETAPLTVWLSMDSLMQYDAISIEPLSDNSYLTSMDQVVVMEHPAIQTDDTEVIGDVPLNDSSYLIYQRALLCNPGQVTQSWRQKGETTAYPLIDILSRCIASNNRRPRQSYAGILQGEGFTLGSYVRHPLNNNRVFEVVSGSHDLFEDEVEVQLDELLPFEDVNYSYTAQYFKED